MSVLSSVKAAGTRPLPGSDHPMIDDLLVELSERARATGDPRDVRVVTTEVSWVLLGPEAYKIKRPVASPFLDFSTPALRERACWNELRVNRRLAPRTYRDVVPVRRTSEGRYTLESGGGLDDGPVLARGRASSTGPIVDWAVRMRRLDDEQRADALLARGELGRERVDSLARTLAAFHAVAETGPAIAACGSPDALERSLTETFASLREAGEQLVDADVLEAIERWQLSYVRGHREELEERVARGAVRDGHGDLLLQHVFLEEGNDDFEVIDGVEFDDRFRYVDVCADVATLAADLTRSGRADLAERLLDNYARASHDFDLFRFVDFYASHRACVRAMLVISAATRSSASPDELDAARVEARRYLMAARSVMERPLLDPVVVVVAGAIASGKSSLAERLGEELSAPVIDAEGARTYVLGAARAPGRAAAEQATSFSQGVYAEMLRRADSVLASGRSVVLDASFRAAASRTAARDLANAHHARFRFLECVAPEHVRRARVLARSRTSPRTDASSELAGAAPAVGAGRAGTGAPSPLAELPPTEHARIDTSASLEKAVAEAKRAIAWSRRLVV